MTNLGNGIYVDTLNISTSIYFVFADGGPSAWNNDWTAFNSTYRYGPTSTIAITTGTEYSTAKRDNNWSYYFTGDGSDYLFSFNTDNLTFKLEILENQPVVLSGDVNDDGFVNITDVSMLINYLLGSEPNGFNAANANVNQDNDINISDATMLINMVLNAS